MQDRLYSLARSALARSLTSQLYLLEAKSVCEWRANLAVDAAILNTAERARSLLSQNSVQSRDQEEKMFRSMAVLARGTLTRGLTHPVLESERRRQGSAVSQWRVNLQRGISGQGVTETCAEARRVIAVFRGRMTRLAFASLCGVFKKRAHARLTLRLFGWRANMHRSVTTQEADEAARSFSLSCARAKIQVGSSLCGGGVAPRCLLDRM